MSQVLSLHKREVIDYDYECNTSQLNKLKLCNCFLCLWAKHFTGISIFELIYVLNTTLE